MVFFFLFFFPLTTFCESCVVTLCMRTSFPERCDHPTILSRLNHGLSSFSVLCVGTSTDIMCMMIIFLLNFHQRTISDSLDLARRHGEITGPGQGLAPLFVPALVMVTLSWERKKSKFERVNVRKFRVNSNPNYTSCSKFLVSITRPSL